MLRKLRANWPVFLSAWGNYNLCYPSERN